MLYVSPNAEFLTKSREKWFTIPYGWLHRSRVLLFLFHAICPACHLKLCLSEPFLHTFAVSASLWFDSKPWLRFGLPSWQISRVSTQLLVHLDSCLACLLIALNVFMLFARIMLQFCVLVEFYGKTCFASRLLHGGSPGSPALDGRFRPPFTIYIVEFCFCSTVSHLLDAF